MNRLITGWVLTDVDESGGRSLPDIAIAGAEVTIRGPRGVFLGATVTDATGYYEVLYTHPLQGFATLSLAAPDGFRARCSNGGGVSYEIAPEAAASVNIDWFVTPGLRV